jgi:hypothetical protein
MDQIVEYQEDFEEDEEETTRLTKEREEIIDIPTNLIHLSELCDIETIDPKSIQFSSSHDDDVEFWNLINNIRASHQTESSSSFKISSVLLPLSSLGDSEIRQLARFLQASTTIIEKLLINNKTCGTIKRESSIETAHLEGGFPLFDSDSEWITFASNGRVTANELLVNRPLVSLKCSRLQPHLFITAHAYPTNTHDHELDLKPYRVHIFNTNNNHFYAL